MDPYELWSIGNLGLLRLWWVGALVNNLERPVVEIFVRIVVDMLVLVLSKDTLFILLGVAQELSFVGVLLQISIGRLSNVDFQH